jgi:hypothetical protein
VRFREAASAADAIADADVIYMEPVVQADYTQSRVEATKDRGRTPPVDSRTMRAWRLLTWLESWRFILCSFCRSYGWSFRARTRSTLRSPRDRSSRNPNVETSSIAD